MEVNHKISCPCCSGNLYEDCCKPLHDGNLPENALTLMRSRYSAYALTIPEYIIMTTHPESSQYSKNKFAWKRRILKFSKNFSFNKLEILDFKEQKTSASVTFTAHITHNKTDCTFTEKSYFELHQGRWLYRDGQIDE